MNNERNKYEGIHPLFVCQSEFHDVEPIWDGETAFIVGGGSSFNPELAERLKGKNVIGCNEAYRLGSSIVKYCHFLDLSWWNLHREEALKHDIVYTTCELLIRDKELLYFKPTNKGVEFSSKTTLSHNRNTGLSAINLAIHFGARRIVLLGFDMNPSDDGKTHWYERNHETNYSTLRMHRKRALEVYEDIDKHGGIEIINGSTISKLPYWPKVTPEEAVEYE